MNQETLDAMYDTGLQIGYFAIPAALIVGTIAWGVHSFKKCKSTIDHIRNRKPGQP